MVETSHEVALTSKCEKADSRVAPHQARSQEEKSRPAQARNPNFSRRLGASDGDVASYEGPQIITVPLYPSFSPCGWPSPSQHGPSPQSQFWSLRAQSTLHSVSGAAPAGEVLARSVLAHRSSSSSSSSSSVSSSFSVDSQASPAPWALARSGALLASRAHEH